jgi:hypothetical protein
MSGRMPHDLNCLTISELQKHAAVMMDKQTRDYYNEVPLTQEMETLHHAQHKGEDKKY